MRTILTLLCAVHGALHLLGFLKWGRAVHLPELTGRTLVTLTGPAQQVFATGWLLACLLLLGAAGVRVWRPDSFWVLALPGIALSQVLIILSWADARWGTLANVLLLVPALAAAGHAHFVRQTDAEERALLAAASPTTAAPIRLGDVEQLPPPVRRWLEHAGVVGHPPARTVRLVQHGELRTRPDGAWMNARARQLFTTQPPAFLWRVETGLWDVLPITGRDLFHQQHGAMVIKLASLVNLVDARGSAIDQGTALRFLGELVWFPSAALAPYIEWQALDDASARATFRQGPHSVSATFEFNQTGQFVRLTADRYFGGGADAKLTPWVVTANAWTRFRGVEVPSHGTVSWTLETGEFTYYRWRLEALDFDVAEEPDRTPHGGPPAGAAARRSAP